MYLYLALLIAAFSFGVVFFILYRRSKEPMNIEGNLSAQGESTSSEITEIYTCNTAIEANLIASKLNDAGIETFLADENVAAANPMLTSALGGVKVKIRTTDYEQAKIVLADYIELEVKCPKCGSNNTITYFKSDDAEIDSNESYIELTSRLDKQQEYETAYHCNDCEHDFE